MPPDVADTAAQTFVTAKFRDAAALVREHEIPHRPAKSGFSGSRFSGA